MMKKDTEYIKCKTTGTALFGAIVMLFCLWIPVLAIRSIIEDFSGILSDFLLLLFFCGIFLLLLNLIRGIRYIIIKKDKLIYYSFLRPFGKTLYFSDYIAKIVVQEKVNFGTVNVVHLINKMERTTFKIPGGHYEKFGRIIRGIPLKSINFKPTRIEYYKLMFGISITIDERRILRQNDVKQKATKNKSKLTKFLLRPNSLLSKYIRYRIEKKSNQQINS